MLVFLLAVTACTADNGDNGDGAVDGDDAANGDDAAGDDDAALPEETAPAEADAPEGGDEETTAESTEEGEDVAQADGEGLLAEVRSRGTLNCGINDAVPGFGVLGEDGDFTGFDVDFCRVIAAAVLGDAEAVELIPIGVEQRFTSLQSGEIDVLSRNTTWSAGRDGDQGAAFVTTTFYDGAGVMVRAESEFESIADMADTAVCVLSGTTTEVAVAATFAAQGVAYEPITFDDIALLQEAFVAERCDVWASDKSQLAGVRSTFPDGPDALRILEETISKEPLGPLVLDGDSEWYDAVNWAVLVTMLAEEFEITSENVEEMTTSDNADILQLLGQPDPEEDTTFDPGLGLELDFAVDVISQVGSYDEIYDRNLGPDTPLGLERLLNNLWTEGGLHYPPPYRP